MYTTSERLIELKARLRRYRRRRENYLQAGLFAVSAILSFALVTTIGRFAGKQHGGEISGMSGAIMLYEDAGGYVLVGLISFMVAVVVTILCIRYRKKK